MPKKRTNSQIPTTADHCKPIFASIVANYAKDNNCTVDSLKTESHKKNTGHIANIVKKLKVNNTEKNRTWVFNALRKNYFGLAVETQNIFEQLHAAAEPPQEEVEPPQEPPQEEAEQPAQEEQEAQDEEELEEAAEQPAQEEEAAEQEAQYEEQEEAPLPAPEVELAENTDEEQEQKKDDVYEDDYVDLDEYWKQFKNKYDSDRDSSPESSHTLVRKQENWSVSSDSESSEKKEESQSSTEPPPAKKRIFEHEKENWSVSSDSKTSEKKEESQSSTEPPPAKKRIFEHETDDETNQWQGVLKSEADRMERVGITESVTTEQTSVILDNYTGGTIQVHPDLVKVLKPYQIEGVMFLWRTVCESVDRMKASSGYGGILAHFMGLGKSLQAITFIHTLITNQQYTGTKTCMITCPVNVIYNWKNEFSKWLKGNLLLKPILVVTTQNQKYHRKIINQFEKGGVLIIGHENLVNLCHRKKRFRSQLINPGPDILICDEGHILRNETNQLYITLNEIKTKRRVIITGTPLQNNLQECIKTSCFINFKGCVKLAHQHHILHRAMINFVKPGILGTANEFNRMYVQPIRTGQSADASPMEVQQMKKMAHVLHMTVGGFVQNKGFDVLRPFLQKKFEYTVHVGLSELQLFLYRRYLQFTKATKRNIFCDCVELKKICCHPAILEMSKKSSAESAEPLWWEIDNTNLCCDEIQKSGKLVLTIEIIKECVSFSEKVLVFSSSLDALTMLEGCMKKCMKWKKGTDYERLDGSVIPSTRNEMICLFNTSKSLKAMIISTNAGGVGINLVAATRVIILSSSWNPGADIQAIFRAYRMGQDKEVFVYRLLSDGSMEEKIYQRQIQKLGLAHLVLNDEQITRIFTEDDLKQVYTLEVRDKLYNIEDCQDRLLKNILCDEINLRWVKEIREHDSLLSREEREDLTEQQKHTIWQEFRDHAISSLATSSTTQQTPAPTSSVPQVAHRPFGEFFKLGKRDGTR